MNPLLYTTEDYFPSAVLAYCAIAFYPTLSQDSHFGNAEQKKIQLSYFVLSTVLGTAHQLWDMAKQAEHHMEL